MFKIPDYYRRHSAAAYCARRENCAHTQPSQRAIFVTNAVATTLGIPRRRLRRRFTESKSAANLVRDRVTIYDDGTLSDANGEHVGNIYEDSRAD
jgi:hypothetical protein